MIENIEDLTVFMNKEAQMAGRTESDQRTVNGRGIKMQWKQADKFPYPIFYMEYQSDKDHIIGGKIRKTYDMQVLWFDKDGNVTEPPPKG